MPFKRIQITESLDAAVTERLAAKYQPLIHYACDGLSHHEARALLDRMRRVHGNIH